MRDDVTATRLVLFCAIESAGQPCPKHDVSDTLPHLVEFFVVSIKKRLPLKLPFLLEVRVLCEIRDVIDALLGGLGRHRLQGVASV